MHNTLTVENFLQLYVVGREYLNPGVGKNSIKLCKLNLNLYPFYVNFMTTLFYLTFD